MVEQVSGFRTFDGRFFTCEHEAFVHEASIALENVLDTSLFLPKGIAPSHIVDLVRQHPRPFFHLADGLLAQELARNVADHSDKELPFDPPTQISTNAAAHD